MGVSTRAYSSGKKVSDDCVLRGVAVNDIMQMVRNQLAEMALRLNAPLCRARLACIEGCAAEHLDSVAELIRTGQIDPSRRVRLAECDGPALIHGKPLRLGVFPITADPLHWGHMLCALAAMTTMRLDKVIFVIAGTDPRKPWLSAAEVRHQLARSVIDLFKPLFSSSPIALGTDLDGEANLFRLLALNPDQQIDAFYIAGTDHCRRVDSKGEPDTVQKIEQALQASTKRSRRNHKVSLVFVRREGAKPGMDFFDSLLDIHVLHSTPLSCSSTAIRKSLYDGSHCDALAALPFVAYQGIQQLGLYANHASMHT